MASHLNPPFKYRAQSILSKSMQFQRGEGKTKTKRIQRKITLKFKHIIISFILLGGLFYGIQQSYLFLISWSHLNVKQIKIVCQRLEVSKDVHKMLEGKNLGNILLLNIDHIRTVLTKHRWVKEIHVRKIFPSTLKIEIKERKPVALLKKDQLYLIDKEGILLERINSEDKANLPLLIDTNNFQTNQEEKLNLAWGCLQNLSPSQRILVKVMDLSNYDNITVQLQGNPTKLILGNNLFSQKLKVFQNFSEKSEKWGPLEYADLRFFQNRLYIRPQKNMPENIYTNSTKEAY